MNQTELFQDIALAARAVAERQRLSPDRAELRRDRGQRRAEVHADADLGNWKLAATGALQHFLGIQKGKAFLAEEFISWSRKRLYRQPPDGRAWGAVFTRARKAGLIEQAGTARAATSNLSPKPLWREKL